MGLFVVFEGPEGSGKSTQATLLAEALAGSGYEVIRTREPGGTPISERIRAVVLDPAHGEMLAVTEALLYAASRAQLVGEVIAPALARGAVVVCDRFVDSSLAYQVGGRGLPEAAIAGLQQLATGGLVPDLKILLDLLPEAGLARRFNATDGINRLDATDLAFHRRVVEFYHHLIEVQPAGWLRLDATRPVADLAEEILRAVGHRLAARTAIQESCIGGGR